MADYNGSATLTVTTSDGSLSSTDSIAVTITPVADITPDAASTQVNTPVTINVLGNDTFENAGATITKVNSSAITDGGPPVAVANGSVTLVSGKLVFTPQAGFIGLVPSFSYTVSSGGVDETAGVDITVSGASPPVNMVPGAQTTDEDTPRVFSTANGSAISVADADSASLTTTVSTNNGTLTALAFRGATISNNGNAAVTISGTAAAINGALDGLSYASVADYNGRATLTVSTSDGTLANSDTITITISAVADIVPDSVSTMENTAVSFNAVTGANGGSADSFEDPGRAVTEVTQGTNGTVSFTAGGLLSYTPNAGYSGADSFTYTVTSGGVTETAAVSMTISAVNAAPVITSNGGAAAAAVSVAENGTAVTAVAASDANLPVQTLTYSITGGADGGKFVIDAGTGVLAFASAPDYEAPTDAGANNVYDVVVQVSDGALTDSQAMAVTGR